jgi:tetratricopeptide (TPR) repeat protein
MQQTGKSHKPVVGQDPEDLIEWYRRMLAVYPRNIQVRIKLGWLLQKLGRHQEALAEWQEVLKIDANNLNAREAILQLNNLVGEKASSGETASRGETAI